MKESEIKLLKDAMINALIENADLKNQLEDARKSSSLWYKLHNEIEQKLRDLTPEPEAISENIEPSDTL